MPFFLSEFPRVKSKVMRWLYGYQQYVIRILGPSEHHAPVDNIQGRSMWYQCSGVFSIIWGWGLLSHSCLLQLWCLTCSPEVTSVSSANGSLTSLHLLISSEVNEVQVFFLPLPQRFRLSSLKCFSTCIFKEPFSIIQWMPKIENHWRRPWSSPAIGSFGMIPSFRELSRVKVILKISKQIHNLPQYTLTETVETMWAMCQVTPDQVLTVTNSSSELC